MKIRIAKFDCSNKYVGDTTEIEPNKWTSIIPYAIKQNVFIQDYKNNVSFSWVGADIKTDENNLMYVNGLIGGIGQKLIKCWMLIPLPEEDFYYWHSEEVWDSECPKIIGKKYLVCAECCSNGHTIYNLSIDCYRPSRKGDWERHNLNSNKIVMAWREIPEPYNG